MNGIPSLHMRRPGESALAAVPRRVAAPWDYFRTITQPLPSFEGIPTMTDGGGPPGIRENIGWDIPGTYQFTIPDGVFFIKVDVVGGGGGGNYAGDAKSGYTEYRGADGQKASKYLFVSPGTVFSVTVGAGGVYASSGASTNGGPSSFGTIVTVSGGAGGAGTVVSGRLWDRGTGGYYNVVRYGGSGHGDPGAVRVTFTTPF